MMQALMPVFAILGVAAGAQLTLLPYAYLADPLPVYHQSQDTRIGVHAYSYAGGPSAKEEVRGLDGVTRGSYSYVDAHGILQSVFYVADEGGFRVAATNLPSDGDLRHETGEVLLVKNAHLQDHAKAVAQEAEKQAVKKVEEQEVRATSRRRRSLEASADQDQRQAENPSSQADQADRDPSPRDSHELPAPEKKVAGSVIAPVYGLLRSVLIPRLTGTATSHQSRVDIHNNVRLKAIQPLETISVLAEPEYKTLLLPAQLPLATSHQSRLQVHNNLHVETPERSRVAVEVQAPAVAAVKLQSVPVITVPDYNENRIQLHKRLGLEGPNRKDAVKIEGAQVAVVDTPVAVPAVSVVASKETLPVVSAVSSQSKTQIHRSTNLKVAVPIASEPTVYVAASYAQPITTWPIYAPIAQSSQYRSQIHSSEKIELAK
ncbi:hypothetical protein DMN91_007619 [Ooceraea biroi]|uniref:Cuticle protein n=1 Tax=Ooceraea biroi TaxID=2015173 RepID=A0A026X3D4_OOCBI|nr:uncharacterized protein LOC105274735 [Ooceraea biroi]EZA62772.1 Cuticle protein [Ooceraea biroi]RLU21003.1 hypothetical protein DMN91_007619 [Ooceraea biroi]